MLRASRARGAFRLMRPSALHLSPAVGMIVASSPVFTANLFRAGAPGMLNGHLGAGYGAAASLAQEMLHEAADGEVRLCRSRSRAAAYLTPAIAGHILGLSLSRASATVIDITLRSIGVQTNRINGEWTGVSLARFRRLVSLLQESISESSSTPAVQLLLMCTWERVENKQCLLDFVLALDSHHPVLAHDHERIREAGPFRDDWLRAHFSPAELCSDSVNAAAQKVLEACSSRDGFRKANKELADALELVAVSIGQASFSELPSSWCAHAQHMLRFLGECLPAADPPPAPRIPRRGGKARLCGAVPA